MGALLIPKSGGAGCTKRVNFFPKRSLVIRLHLIESVKLLGQCFLDIGGSNKNLASAS